jgi:uncharacterized RDD family membrane protein YckC
MTTVQASSPDPYLRGHYAGFVSRLLAFLIDLLVMVTIQFIYVVVIRLVFNFLGLNSLMEAVAPANTVTQSSVNPIVLLITWGVAFLSSVIFFGLYVSICWTLIDRTIGQAFIGLRVLRTNGEKLTFRRAIRRAVGYFLAAIPLFFGFIWILVDDRRQGWHDKLADTVVVYDWDARLSTRVKEWLARQQATRDAALSPPNEVQLPHEDNSHDRDD